MKKIIIAFSIIFSLTLMFKITATANSCHPMNQQQSEKKEVFTREQKAKIEQKSKELKEKYLKDYEKMTTEQRNAAVAKYREEIRKYIKEEFGVSKDVKPTDPLENFDVDKYMRKFME